MEVPCPNLQHFIVCSIYCHARQVSFHREAFVLFNTNQKLEGENSKHKRNVLKMVDLSSQSSSYLMGCVGPSYCNLTKQVS